jgi:uncharacterized protein
MINLRWLLAIPVVMGAMLAAEPGQAAAIRDTAGMFSVDVVSKANSELERLERSTGIPIVIETIEQIPGLAADSAPDVRRKAIAKLAVERDREIHDEGLYLLISKRDHVISPVLVRERLASAVGESKREAIVEAFRPAFKKKDFDGGLTNAVKTIESTLEGVTVGKSAVHRGLPGPGGHAAAPVGRRAEGAGGGSGLGTFLMIGLGIFGVLLVLRVLGGLFGRSQGGGYPGQMGMQRPGMGGPGMGGPGYGAPGYGGGGGGGFMSGLLGGLGGAVAGNWLYDQFSGGRHGGANEAGGYQQDASSSGVADQGGDEIVGGNDGGASWDDTPADSGGGDWGGGGGDWGGGGGGDGGGDW